MAKGVIRCPVCGKLMRAYCKVLDRRLAGLAEEILIWLKTNNRRAFNPREVFKDEHIKINDVQKLGYFRRELRRLGRMNRVKIRSLYKPYYPAVSQTTDYGP